mmetsp:Transcript_9412/g.28187  ORF Transcript_9412/g.28187 Transcript_9412/m.28187 type:complete len:213 (-) Transcript_9412:115-753(-)
MTANNKEDEYVPLLDGAEKPPAPTKTSRRRVVALALAVVTLVAGLSALAVSNQGQGVVVASTHTSLASCDFGCGELGGTRDPECKGKSDSACNELCDSAPCILPLGSTYRPFTKYCHWCSWKDNVLKCRCAREKVVWTYPPNYAHTGFTKDFPEPKYVSHYTWVDAKLNTNKCGTRNIFGIVPIDGFYVQSGDSRKRIDGYTTEWKNVLACA